MLGEALFRALAARTADGRFGCEPARSDDCNHFAVAGSQIWFRIARGGDCFAFHSSMDGALWELVRYFAFDDAAGISAGFLAQSPTGEGCRVSFDEIRFEAGRLTDLRCGG